ncbi:MAG: hypothetical protein GY768_07035 [Planctomycetaceae bacterium]|nr:hypothetical protein [Planctomycetaceae bacterium]
MFDQRLRLCCLTLACMGIVSIDLRAEPSQDPAIQPIPESVPFPLYDCPTSEQLRKTIKPIGGIRASLHVDPKFVEQNGLPVNCSGFVFQARQRPRALYSELVEFNWKPTNFFHQPLYFDDQPLERYGQSVCPPLQPVLSGGRFFMTFPIVPYKIGLNPLHECVTTLGYERPGECVPCVREKVMPAFELDAGLLQTGTVLALIFLLP